MSEIKKLIERLCPDGVEYKKLGEIADITIGEFVHKNKQNPMAPYPVYNGGTTYTGFYDNYNNEGNKIVISARGYAGFVNRVFDKYWAGNSSYTIAVNSPHIIWHYVYYYLKNEQYNIMSMQQKGGGVPAISKKQIQEIEIPVPPIEVQSKIVEILDNFTELEAKLEAELEAELEARRKQYEYYRNQLLTFDKDKGARFDVKWMKLREISMYAKERIDGNLLSTDNYVGVENLLKDKGGKTSSSSVPSGNAIKFKPGDILIGNIRPYLKKIWLANIIGGTNGDVLCIRVSRNDLVSSDYLYKCLSSDSFFNYDNSHAKGGKMPRGDKKAVMEYSIPIPQMEEQKRIVSILDRFEALTTDLQSGLPAEIEARRKQYEYYREQLLTFKRKTV